MERRKKQKRYNSNGLSYSAGFSLLRSMSKTSLRKRKTEIVEDEDEFELNGMAREGTNHGRQNGSGSTSSVSALPPQRLQQLYKKIQTAIRKGDTSSGRRSTRYRPPVSGGLHSGNPRYKVQTIESLDVLKVSPFPLHESLPEVRQTRTEIFSSNSNKKDINNLLFSSLELNREEQREVCVDMLMTTIPGARLKRSTAECLEAVKEFVASVQSRYTDTAYHNFRHAVDVAQLMYIMIHNYLDTAQFQLTAVQPFQLLVIALCHDAGHFGASNSYLRKTGGVDPDTREVDPTADIEHLFVERFGVDSTLEHFHLVQAREIMDSCALFSQKFMDSEDKEELLTFAKKLIIATDVELHAVLSKQLNAIVSENTSFLNKIVRKKKKAEYPTLYLITVLKMCDLANLIRAFDDHVEWTKCIQAEYGSMQEAYDMDPRRLIARQLVLDPWTPEKFISSAKFTMDFINTYGISLCSNLDKISKGAAGYFAGQMRANIAAWKREIAKQQSKLERIEESNMRGLGTAERAQYKARKAEKAAREAARKEAGALTKAETQAALRKEGRVDLKLAKMTISSQFSEYYL